MTLIVSYLDDKENTVYYFNNNWKSYKIRLFNYKNFYFGSLFIYNNIDSIVDCPDLLSLMEQLTIEKNNIRNIQLYDNDEKKLFDAISFQFTLKSLKFKQTYQHDYIDIDINFGEGLMLSFIFNNNYMNNFIPEENNENQPLEEQNVEDGIEM